jgi:hypothetical protein
MRFILRNWLRPDTYVDEEEVPIVLSVFTPIKPLTTSLLLETFADLTRGKAEMLAENALLRHQLIILRR